MHFMRFETPLVKKLVAYIESVGILLTARGRDAMMHAPAARIRRISTAAVNKPLIFRLLIACNSRNAIS